MVDAVRLIVDQAGGVGRERARGRARARRRRCGRRRPTRAAARANARARGRRSRGAGGDRHVRAGVQRAGARGPAAGRALARLARQRRREPARRAAARAHACAIRASAAAQLAHALDATRIAIVSQRQGAAARVRDAASAHAAPADRHRAPVAQLDASATRAEELVTELQAAQVQVVALAGSPGAWATDLLRALAQLPQAHAPGRRRAADASTRSRSSAGAGPAAEGVRVISRLVPAEQLGGSARSFASAYADLHGAAAAGRGLRRRRRADAVLDRRGGRGRLARHDGGRARGRCPRTTRCSAAGPRRRTAASRRAGWPCWWSTTGRSGSSGWCRSRTRCRRPAT